MHAQHLEYRNQQINSTQTKEFTTLSGDTTGALMEVFIFALHIPKEYLRFFVHISILNLTPETSAFPY